MKIFYNNYYNIDLGLLNFLHPFDGCKFKKIYNALKSEQGLSFITPSSPVNIDIIDDFISEMMQLSIRNKNAIFRALEVPRLPFISISFLDKRVLIPMRWGVAGTIDASIDVLNNGGTCWNLSGGYHHASPNFMEGFCIYNDIGICYQRLLDDKLLDPDDKILIIDIDAHHGNGNAFTFKNNNNVTILDIYNTDLYPKTSSTRKRVDISVPLITGTGGEKYLRSYNNALDLLNNDYRLAFVVAGTDVLSTDKLGGFNLEISDVIQREKRTVNYLKHLGIPAVMLGGGGYSKESAQCVVRSILACA